LTYVFAGAGAVEVSSILMSSRLDYLFYGSY